MKLKFSILIFLYTIFSGSINAQEVAVGKWKTHFSYYAVDQIAQSENKIFGVSQGALFSLDKEDNSMDTYSKINGLSDSNVTGISFDKTNNQLLIVYSDGNIDILSSSGIINIPDLFNKSMSTSKSVNSIFFYNNRAYLSCDFGILVLNLTKHEVADTYIIGLNSTEVKVLALSILNGQIYAITNSSVYTADLAKTNLVDYENWSTMLNPPGNGNLQNIASYGGKLVLLRGNKIYVRNSDNTWSQLLPQVNVSDFFVSNGKMLVSDGSSKMYIVDSSFNTTVVNNVGAFYDASYDANLNRYWLASGEKGIETYDPTSNVNNGLSYFIPDGPASNTPWDLMFAGQKLFMVQGGRWATQYFLPGDVMMYENGSWTNLDPAKIDSATGTPPLDFVNVAVDSSDNKHFFVTSYGEGLYEFKDNKFSKWYNFNNSTIQSIFPGSYNYMRLDGAVFDKEGNLFMVNTNTNSSIKVLLNNGKWAQLTYKDANLPTLGKILISSVNPNQKWVASVRYTPGVFVFDDNGTITDQSDDKSIFLQQFNYWETQDGTEVLKSIVPKFVFTIAQDKDGVIWVGTDQGPFLFYNTSNVFNSDYTCSRVKIPRNDGSGLADYLLQNEYVKAIAVDGANRKWIGTENSGVYLMSANGQQTIHHFTVSNSPLLSNNILSIAINPVTGEVFFGTTAGLISYQSDAKNASDTFNDVHAFPNPVRPGYTGLITITGLIANTNVKITDINGNLVCETVSKGGYATWDGKNAEGKRVASGIYLAICVSEDGTQNAIAKIMIIN